MHRLLCLLAAMCLLAAPACAEETLTLPECTTVEQADALVLYPDEGQPVEAERGKVRLIAQSVDFDPEFCPEYWYGGAVGGDLDLTLEKAPGNRTYPFYAGNMCTRAVYSMALSYLGVNVTPGIMSAMSGKRVVYAPYDGTTNTLPQVERVSYSAFVFDRMFEAYQSDSRYSPIYLYFRKPNGVTHALLVVGRQEDGRYIVVDPGYHTTADGEPLHVYTITLSTTAQMITGSDFHNEHVISYVQGLCQWRLVETE